MADAVPTYFVEVYPTDCGDEWPPVRRFGMPLRRRGGVGRYVCSGACSPEMPDFRQGRHRGAAWASRYGGLSDRPVVRLARALAPHSPGSGRHDGDEKPRQRTSAGPQRARSLEKSPRRLGDLPSSPGDSEGPPTPWWSPSSASRRGRLDRPARQNATSRAGRGEEFF